MGRESASYFLTLVPELCRYLTTSTMNKFYLKIQQFFDYAKKCIGIWDDRRNNDRP